MIWVQPCHSMAPTLHHARLGAATRILGSPWRGGGSDARSRSVVRSGVVPGLRGLDPGLWWRRRRGRLGSRHPARPVRGVPERGRRERRRRSCGQGLRRHRALQRRDAELRRGGRAELGRGGQRLPHPHRSLRRGRPHPGEPARRRGCLRRRHPGRRGHPLHPAGGCRGHRCRAGPVLRERAHLRGERGPGARPAGARPRRASGMPSASAARRHRPTPPRPAPSPRSACSRPAS